MWQCEHQVDGQFQRGFEMYVGGGLGTVPYQADAHHDADSAHRLVEEAQLFLEACHSCYGRVIAQAAAV